MWMTRVFSRLPDGTDMMADCTEVNCALPSAATKRLVCAVKVARPTSNPVALAKILSFMWRKLNDSATGCHYETVVKSCKPPGDFGIGLVECVVVLQQTVFRGRALPVGCGGAMRGTRSPTSGPCSRAGLAC